MIGFAVLALPAVLTAQTPEQRTQRREEARAEYAEAVKLNPQNQDAKKALDALK